MAQRFEPGDCHICRQTDVKVRRLWCNRHNYCMMCAEFVPRFVAGDLRCQRCPKENKQIFNKNKEDCFLASRTEGRPRRRRPKPVSEFEKLIDFDDSEEDNDLEGNNEEWDQLLESLTKPAAPVKTPPPKKEPDRFCPRPIPRKLSFLHFSLPSAHDDVTERTKSPNVNLISNTVTQLLNSPHGNKLASIHAESTSATSSNSQLNSAASSRKGLSSKGRMKVRGNNTCSNWTFEMDPSEVERNSSPCKGMRPRSGQSWYSDSPHPVKSPVSESEELMENIRDIQGPDFLSGSSSRSGSGSSLGSEIANKSYDDFWDSNIG